MHTSRGKIKYPQDWLGPESLATIINYAELSKFCKANGLDSGHLSYLIRAIQDTVLANVSQMIAPPKQEVEGTSNADQ